jgi:hypothetical protein
LSFVFIFAGWIERSLDAAAIELKNPGVWLALRLPGRPFRVGDLTYFVGSRNPLFAVPRFASPAFLRTHAMTALWLIFTKMLFVVEPLFLHRWLRARAQGRWKPPSG